MNSLIRSPQFRLMVLLAAAALCLHPVWADYIYVYSADNGRVSLSNVRTDSHYSVLVGTPPAAASAPSVVSHEPMMVNKIRYDRMVEEVANAHGVESALLHAVISVESHYRARAVSRKGAAGLMQLMPLIARQYGVDDPLDPRQNLQGGAKYLRHLLKKFNNDRRLALAAYNAGERAVSKYGNRIPPYRETVAYVPRVLEFYRQYQLNAAAPGTQAATMAGKGNAERFNMLVLQ